ncbi:gluconate 2-dehydrogenase subunit 3 family protein [Methylobacterium nodulans]|uniref:Gluconate 2-dehydrogenase subunit 3 family protein n=1 Tax=Methylobacterium nodulans (strain LMG 21967 / CNCM I-2342 / ORS 2060) TaxID=460265 RepID=B8IEH3_METNO|nr:gluconate 2-dehydrogenase subunit 3 family protein [Methylobacterium nodulans]ACL59545.1 conserved hypothetical protein [Methylobacterium nodulans ORS 2060]
MNRPAPVAPGPLSSRRRLLIGLWRLLLIGGVLLHERGAVAARRPREAHTARTIAAVIDRMLPADELPGGCALGIDRRILALADPELQRSLAAGVAWLDGRARRVNAPDFLALDEARQEAILRAARASTAEGAAAIAWRLREFALTAYYSHPTVMAAFAYAGPPQPGGFPDFEEAPR